MKLTFRQSGGFAGLSKGCELDTQQMPADEAAKLETLVKESQLPDALDDHSPQARDITHYLITVDTGAQSHRLSVDDRTIPEKARPLLRALQQCAKPLPRR